MAQQNTFIPTNGPIMTTPTKTGNKPMNSITPASSSSESTTTNDDLDAGAGAEPSAGEGRATADDDADAQALSGVAKLTVEPQKHLAGEPSSDTVQDDDMMFLDDVDMMDTQTSGGAEDSDSKESEIDDDYTGVDAISDDEDEGGEEIEKDLMKAAEADLRQEYLESEVERTMQDESDWFASELNEAGYRSRNLSIGSDDDDPFGLALNMNDDPFQGAQLFDNEWQGLMNDAELNLWRMPNPDRPREDSFQSTDRPKRVRFAEGEPLSRSSSRSSSGSSDDDADSAYPDIFMDQDDPKIQQLLAQDRRDRRDREREMAGYGSDAGSAYDFEDDADRFAFEIDEESDSTDSGSDSGSELSSDSDDDDGGYETEEETLEEAEAKMKEVCKMSQPLASASAPATPSSSKRTSTPLPRSNSGKSASAAKLNKAKKGPREGKFACDPTKATVVCDSTGKKTVLYMPTNPSAKNKAFWDRARSAASSRDTSPRGSMSITLPGRGGSKEEQPPRPFTAQSTLATMFDGNFDFMHNTAMSPPPPVRVRPQSSAFTPMQSTFTTPAPTEEGSDADGEYQDFNMLVDLDQDSDDEEGGDWSAGATSSLEPTFLSRGMVGSFRLNQHRAKEESSLASHPETRASTSEVNALQTGRRGAGNAPITPARKRRMSKDLNRTNSGIRKPAPPIGSPLSARRPRSRGQSLSGRLDQTLSPGYSLKKQ